MDEQDKHWNSTPGDFDLEWESAHVWSIPLDVSGSQLAELMDTLAPLERRRAESFRFERDRARFIAGRGKLRTILGRYLCEEPAGIEIGYESRGKPMLTGRFAGGDLQFNLAHCDNLAVVALARGRQAGIDIERVRELEGMEQIVATICSPRQIAEFGTLPCNERIMAFFRLWTRKEAWLKATGVGIGISLEMVEPAFRADAAPSYRSLPQEFARQIAAWSLHELVPSPGFIAALALGGPVTRVKLCEWFAKDTFEYANA